MFRDTQYCNRYEYISIQLSTPVVLPGDNTRQTKNGYTFLVNDRSSYFDWYNAYLNVNFKVDKLADGAGYGANDAVAMINDSASLIDDMRVKQNGKIVYDGTNLFRVTNIRNLLEMSRDYAETTGTSEYFYLDSTDNTEMRADHTPNTGFKLRHGIITNAAIRNSIIPLNKFTFFGGLRRNILPPSQIQLEFGLAHDDNLIYRANAADEGRVVVTKLELWIPRMIFNADGLSYVLENHTRTMWTYHREMVQESQSSRQAESTFNITAGVKNPKHVFVYFQRTNKTTDQNENPHIYDTFKINATDNNCKFQSARLEVGNGIYYPELEYSEDNLARMYRDVINYTGKQNDKNTGSLLTRYNYERLFGLIHFNLIYSDESLISSDPKQLILRYRLNQAPAAGANYKVYAIILYEEQVKVDVVGNETVIV